MSVRALYARHSLATSETSIRVLDVAANPSSDSQLKEVISGNLRVVDLNNKPVFTALSYVWGERSEPENDVIHCEGIASRSRIIAGALYGIYRKSSGRSRFG
jgi:hypothetical protein